MINIPGCRAYVRVSTDNQVNDGESIGVQEARVKDHCNYKRLELIQIYKDEGISAKNIKDRPGLTSLLTDIKKGEYVLVTDLSRFSRNTRDALNMFELIKQKGAYFACMNPDIDFSTSIGELVFTMYMAIHKIERDNVSKHVSSNMQQLSKEKRLRTKPPYGWKFVGKNEDMIKDEAQQEVIEKIKNMYVANLTLKKISDNLNENGYGSTLKNGKFYPETVRRILIDCGLKDGDRTPVQQRIVSHHK